MSEYILLIIRKQKLWLVLFLVCFFIQLFQLQDVFRFDRQLIEQWQIWRTLSGHLSHLNWSHFWLNMAGLAMVSLFFSCYQSALYWLGALLFLALFSSAGMLLDQQLDRYVGLSGVLHGLFIIGARMEMKHYKISGAVLLLIIIGKVIWEQAYGALPGSESMTGGRIAINAHLYGALGGVLYLFKKGYKKI